MAPRQSTSTRLTFIYMHINTQANTKLYQTRTNVEQIGTQRNDFASNAHNYCLLPYTLIQPHAHTVAAALFTYVVVIDCRYVVEIKLKLH